MSWDNFTLEEFACIDDGSSYTITWPSVNWVGGVAPTLPTSGYGIVELWKVGSQLYGAFAGGVA